ncbi:MAG: 4-hydroxy-tetrahydrodipicolinate synthase [Bdellovibrio sp.]
MSTSLAGVWTALVTPFQDQVLDLKSFERIVEYQLDSGIRHFVLAGSTGEGSQLETRERKVLFDCFRSISPRESILFLATGSIQPTETLAQSLQAQDWGADGVLVSTPPYTRPPQRGLIDYFWNLADQLACPIFLYDVPARTGVRLEIGSIEKLFEHPRIVGIKDATGDMKLLQQIQMKFKKSKVFLSGEDATYSEFLANGGHGIISVASHVFPRDFLQPGSKSLADFLKIISRESNPMGIKMALYLVGLLTSPELRPPLVRFSEQASLALKEFLLDEQ